CFSKTLPSIELPLRKILSMSTHTTPLSEILNFRSQLNESTLQFVISVDHPPPSGGHDSSKGRKLARTPLMKTGQGTCCTKVLRYAIAPATSIVRLDGTSAVIVVPGAFDEGRFSTRIDSSSNERVFLSA